MTEHMNAPETSANDTPDALTSALQSFALTPKGQALCDLAVDYIRVTGERITTLQRAVEHLASLVRAMAEHREPPPLPGSGNDGGERERLQ
jgi:hypothetical protein